MVNDIFNQHKLPSASLIKVSHVCYFLQALTFVTCISLFVAVIISYVKYADARGTWLESHFKWQIRTFWYCLLWSIVGIFAWLLLLGWVVWGLTTLWLIYRIVRGWLALNDGKPMYV